MPLFRDRNFNIAILISASWHLLCMFSITPLLLPTHIKENSSTISFLGSILERVIPVPEKTLSLNKVPSKFVLRPPAEAIPRYIKDRADKEKMALSGDISRPPVFKLHYRGKKKGIKFKDILVEGEAGNRPILYKPELPRISILPFDFSSNYTVTVKFRVSKYGFVETPECIVSSGSSNVDQLAIRYIRRWQFVPQKEAQEGVVRLSFGAL